MDTLIAASVYNVALVPSWEDYESLPQVHAFVLEALRWRPVLPIGEWFFRQGRSRD